MPSMSKFAEYSHESEERNPLHSGNGLVIQPAGELDLDEVAAIASEREGGEVEHWRQVFGRIYFARQASAGSLLLVNKSVLAKLRKSHPKSNVLISALRENGFIPKKR